ncbi:hypothetical protein Poly51_45920 [Rubripirellula tenax]|uniref:Uncharacterized protein n=1 Tax=Rubripirellula tenax TaxID=2528015 RepID=A0A5C6EM46_9BACT|nr:hypothetical protein [Rubripirellula tenax]TWU48691.1 hypothetical protein Poly51_45920 [Rubripirellula tenax]
MATFYQAIASVALTMCVFAGSAFADTYRHIDLLALQIARETKLLVLESSHYRHTPQYRHLLDDTRDMARLADHIHDLAHHHGELVHMESDVAQLDAKFHHLEGLFHAIEREARFGNGRIYGNTAHVGRLLHSIEDAIHHLQDDLRDLRRFACDNRNVITSRRVAVPDPIRYAPRTQSLYWNGPPVRNTRDDIRRGSGFGISFGGGRRSGFSFQF